MAVGYTGITYKETGFFSKLVTDFLAGNENLNSFYKYRFDKDGLQHAIKDRQQYPVDRQILVKTLNEQYSGLVIHPACAANLQVLLSEDTFTVCTAHQPNLMTGYLYFVYKILHVIKISQTLKELHPEQNFVPVYYMGSEDNDIEELGVFRFRGEQYRWDGDGQKGAVGRMNTAGLKPLLDKLFQVLGPPGAKCDYLKKLLTETYLIHNTVAKATQFLVNELFGRYGLIVLNPDDGKFKQQFSNVIEDELFHQTSYSIVSEQIRKLGEHYKIQAHPRSLNLFYLHEQLRERIERGNEKWTVVNTAIQWSERELREEIAKFPERFSPNVILRGLYQESILPNIVFIGGGAEVAYWLQLKTLFEYYHIFFPIVQLRQSVLWIDEAEYKHKKNLGIPVSDLFLQEHLLIKKYISENSSVEWQTEQEKQEFSKIFERLRNKATKIDTTLGRSCEAALAKIKHQLENLEKKMLRAEKKKMEVQVSRLIKLKTNLFPNNSLQERVENFLEYYLIYGDSFFDMLSEGVNPFVDEFLVVEHK